MICKNCNTVVDDGSVFCYNCGARMAEAAAEQPAVEQPAVEQPAVEQPAVEQPAVEQPAVEQAAVEQPVAEQPVVEQPVAEQPVVEQPVAEQPAVEQAPAEQPVQTAEPTPSAPAEQEAKAENVFFAENTEPQQNTYPSEPAPKKKFLSKKTAVIAAVLVVLVGAFAAFASFSDLFKSDAEVYQDIELEAIDEALTLFNDSLDEALDFKGGNASVKLTVSDELISMLGADASVLGNVRSAGFDCNYAWDGKLLGGRADISIEDAELFGYELTYDTKNNMAYIAFPGLKDEAIEIDFGEIMRWNGMSSMSELTGSIETVTEFLNKAEIKPVVYDILSAALSEIKNVDKSKGTITAGNVTQNCTVYTVKVDEVLVENMAKAVLREVKGNKNIKELVFDVMDMVTKVSGGPSMYTKDQLSTLIDQGIDSAIQSIDLSGTDFEFDWKMYADGHDIIGREISAMGQTLKYGAAKSGSNYAFEASFGEGADKFFNISIDGTMKSDKFTGEAVFEVEGQSIILAKFTDFKSDIEGKNVQGNMSLSLGEGMADMMDFDDFGSGIAMKSVELEFTFNNTKKTADTKVAVKVGGTALAEVAVKGSMKSDYSPSIPSKVYRGDMEDYVDDIDPTVFVEKLKKAGFPEELFGGMMPVEEPELEADPFAEDFDIEDIIEDMDEEELDEYLKQLEDISIGGF